MNYSVVYTAVETNIDNAQSLAYISDQKEIQNAFSVEFDTSGTPGSFTQPAPVKLTSVEGVLVAETTSLKNVGGVFLASTLNINDISGVVVRDAVEPLEKQSWGSINETRPHPILETAPSLWLSPESMESSSMWLDLSGNSNNVSCTSATIISNAINGHDALHISDTRTCLVPAFLTSSAGEMIFVYKSSATGDNAGFGDWGTHEYMSHFPYNSNNQVYSDFGSATRYDQIYSGLTRGAWTIVGQYSAPNDWALYHNNGASPVYSRTSNSVIWATGDFDVGIRDSYLAELLVWDYKLSDEVRTEVFNILKTKYNL